MFCSFVGMVRTRGGSTQSSTKGIRSSRRISVVGARGTRSSMSDQPRDLPSLVRGNPSSARGGLRIARATRSNTQSIPVTERGALEPRSLSSVGDGSTTTPTSRATRGPTLGVQLPKVGELPILITIVGNT